MSDRSVTVAMHIGLERNLPMLENLIRSFEQCVEHDAPLELMLVDSSGSAALGDWLDGVGIARSHVTLKKLRTEFPAGTHMSTAYMQSLLSAAKAASGRYFVFLAEDNQFVVNGPLLSAYIDAIESVPDGKAIVHLMGQQQYKYSKPNNRFKQPRAIGSVGMFELETTKWCPFALARREAYAQFGDLPVSDVSQPHATIDNASMRARELGYVRFYPQVPHGAWFPNTLASAAVEKIRTLNPGELLIKPLSLDEAEWHASTCCMYDGALRPMSAEDFFRTAQVL